MDGNDPGAADAAALTAWLATHDTKCPVCGYNLRGLREARCPECSSPLHLAVGSDHLVSGPWILAVVSFALAMGFDGVVTVLMTMVAIIEPPVAPGEFKVLAVIFAGFVTLAVVCGLGLVLLIKRRRSWLRQTPRRQWRIAFTVFPAVGLGHLAYGASVAYWLNGL